MALLTKTVAWLSLAQINELMREGTLTTQGNDREELTLYVNYCDRQAARQAEGGKR